MSDHKSAPMTPEARAWTEYLRWTQGADRGQYAETESRAWARLQLALMPAGADSRTTGDALDALAALDASEGQ